MAPVVGKRIGNGRMAEVFEYGEGQVIKLWREPGQQESVAREAEAQQAVRAAGVATPAVIDQVEVDGREGLIMERVDGLDGLTAAEKKPWRIWAIGTATGRLHRQLGQVEAPANLNSVASTARWEITNSPHVPAAARARLLAVLERNLDGRSLCHLDFHPGNVMQTVAGPFVIDLANARAGDPIADHAKSLLLLRIGSPAEVSHWQRVLITLGRRLMAAAYRHGYGRVDQRALARWRPIMVAQRLREGIPEEREKLLRLVSSTLREAERQS